MLKRASITSCSDWTQQYRIISDPRGNLNKFKFDMHPWTKAIHDCEDEDICAQKAAQMGLTETALNRTLYFIDQKRKNALYILPASTPDASDFSSSRFDPAIQLSPHLKKVFNATSNVGHKRAGAASLFIRGSRSRNHLKSIPAAYVVADELEEMTAENISLIPERLSGQLEKQLFRLSTPSVPNRGIHAIFQDSSQHHFYFKCPSCNRSTELVFPDCLKIIGEDPTDSKVNESHLICRECGNKLPHELKHEWLHIDNTEWVESFSNKTITGFYISQLYSFMEPPRELAKKYLRGLTNPSDDQEFWNSKLGLPREPQGSRIDPEDCIGGYTMQSSYSGTNAVVMGVDIGSELHLEITEYKLDANTPLEDLHLRSQARVLYAGTVKEFEHLNALIKAFKVHYIAVDAQPERRKAAEFIRPFPNQAVIVFYNSNDKSPLVTKHPNSNIVTVNRTLALDISLGRFKTGTITLPKDIPLAYKNQIQEPKRIVKKDPDGNPVAAYVSGDRVPDHYGHARNYAEIAFMNLCQVSINTNLGTSL